MSTPLSQLKAFLASALVLMTMSASSQDFAVLLNENFNSATIPPGWSVAQQPGSDGWQFGITSYTSPDWAIPPHPDASQFTASNDDECDCDMSNDRLIAPMVNLIPYDSVTIIFDYFYDGEWGSVAHIQFSYDAGANWFFIPLPAQPTWQINVGLTLANGQDILNNGTPWFFTDQMMFRFVHNDGGGWADGVAIDNVLLVGFSDPCDNITPLACETPETATLQSVGTLDWQHTGLCAGFPVLGMTQLYTFTPAVGGSHTLAVSNVTSNAADPWFNYYFKEASAGCDVDNWTCIGDFEAPGVSAGFDLQEGVEYLIMVSSEEFEPISQTFQIICATEGTCDADAGTLTPDETPVCIENNSATLSASVGTPPVIPAGYQVTYGLADANGVIQQIDPTASFTVGATGDYSIHTLVYDPNTLNMSLFVPGFVTLAQVNSQTIQGGGSICASLDMTGASFEVIECAPACDADAGTLVADASPVCLEGPTVISATVGTAPTVPTGYQVGYGLTDASGTIIDVATAPSFTVNAAGDYTIHTLVYDPLTLNPLTLTPGTTASDVDAMLIQGGGSICGSLDLTGAPVEVTECVPCDTDAGTIDSDNPVLCLENGTANLTATPGGDANVPTGYQTIYVLTEGNGLVIVDTDTDPDFIVTAGGIYTIHTLIYDPNTLDLGTVVLGTTTGFDVNDMLQQGGGTICGSLDVGGALFLVEAPDAGTLSVPNPQTCLINGSGTINGIANGDQNVPAGYAITYGLANAGGTIIQIGPSPVFNVNATGNYTVHTLVYDPNTLDISLFVPGFVTVGMVETAAGSVCASFDATGVAIEVITCAECNADAGTLTADETDICFEGEEIVSATQANAPVVPTGYMVGYALTDENGVILQVGLSPSFTVTAEGTFTVHTVVFDPNELDPLSLPPGTTAAEVNAMLIQGGGVICGALDLVGATTIVAVCPACEADAGSLSGGGEVCLTNGAATLTATQSGTPQVPGGFQTVYVLTQGAGLVILNTSTTPTFVVNATGNYTIHTLVYDPNTLDPSSVTNGLDLNALLEQGGGSICASLDVAGAAFTVVDCTVPCAGVSAGALVTSSNLVCLFGGSAVLAATHTVNPTYPISFEVIYVLTEGAGLTIVDDNNFPVFTVTAGGDYTIHTLVYDPNTLDPSSFANGLDLNAVLLQGGGSICAALDVNGVEIAVPDLESTIGELSWEGDSLYLENAQASTGFQWFFNGNPIPGATGSSYVVQESGNYWVQYTGENGCIQTSNTLAVTYSGGNISVNEQSLFRNMTLFPNPNNGQFSIRGELETATDISIIVMDMTGRQVMPAIVVSGAQGFTQQVDVSSVASGFYFVRVQAATGEMTIRFAKQ